MDITSEEQLMRWVAGDPVHKGDRGDPKSQCCPDFSCCSPDLLQPLEVREAFAHTHATGDEGQRMRMLGQFLGTMISTDTDAKVHIAGVPDTREKEEDE